MNMYTDIFNIGMGGEAHSAGTGHVYITCVCAVRVYGNMRTFPSKEKKNNRRLAERPLQGRTNGNARTLASSWAKIGDHGTMLKGAKSLSVRPPFDSLSRDSLTTRTIPTNVVVLVSDADTN